MRITACSESMPPVISTFTPSLDPVRTGVFFAFPSATTKTDGTCFFNQQCLNRD